ncbi:hypothetical protein GWC77_27180 [Paraburkholderia sp. NMBU_R16]|uniref:hypothetical protein n=1 Tax=Paraburkholderia sp. NMBU_R16 TaxID=2698676 RepID=UPI001565DD54|nr:hypothetical protein [Paraburkholderia sp. NMBU_R16]NRO99553.1 hypothetical protein [Paraburkholderia sp. NMBU_R16]
MRSNNLRHIPTDVLHGIVAQTADLGELLRQSNVGGEMSKAISHRILTDENLRRRLGKISKSLGMRGEDLLNPVVRNRIRDDTKLSKKLTGTLFFRDFPPDANCKEQLSILMGLFDNLHFCSARHPMSLILPLLAELDQVELGETKKIALELRSVDAVSMQLKEGFRGIPEYHNREDYFNLDFSKIDSALKRLKQNGRPDLKIKISLWVKSTDDDNGFEAVSWFSKSVLRDNGEAYGFQYEKGRYWTIDEKEADELIFALAKTDSKTQVLHMRGVEFNGENPNALNSLIAAVTRADGALKSLRLPTTTVDAIALSKLLNTRSSLKDLEISIGPIKTESDIDPYLTAIARCRNLETLRIANDFILDKEYIWEADRKLEKEFRSRIVQAASVSKSLTCIDFSGYKLGGFREVQRQIYKRQVGTASALTEGQRVFPSDGQGMMEMTSVDQRPHELMKSAWERRRGSGSADFG